jgi:quinol-cytochrome oxidoreductase complex cytochrome b subunit
MKILLAKFISHKHKFKPCFLYMMSVPVHSISNSVSVPKGIAKASLLSISKAKALLPLNLPRVNKNYIFDIVDSHLIHYPTPITLTYAWSFGSLAGICLVIQMISGIFLAMHYTPHIDLAFSSVEYIMRDVNNGWLVRYIHANGASMFFIVVYAHIGRGLYYGSYMAPREFLWCSGVIILLLMMGTAFTGYVLPWGQMSFWGATVITNMVTAIPVAGKHIVQWLWGGYTVSNPTLNRFFSIHFVLPFVIAGLTLLHLALLHREGSNNPIGSDTGIDDIPFYPYLVVKDIFALSCFLVFFATFVFYFPNTLNHPDNYIPADPLETPAHVVPEWYFLPYYAILRSIPHKAGGIAAMGGAILVLLAIPFINTSVIRNTTYRPIFKFCFWLFIADFILLIWVGQKPVKDSYILLGQICTLYYFAFFLIIIPLAGIIESKLIHHKSE